MREFLGQGWPDVMKSLLLLSLVAGCSNAASPENSGAADSASGVTTTTGTDDSDTATSSDTAAPAEPAWYAVDAEMSVVGGFAVPTPASVSLTVVDADLERVLCEVPLDVAGMSAGAAPVSGVWLWWSLPVEPVESSCATLPATLALGIGELVPDVRAQLGAVGLDGAGGSIYGAFVAADDLPTVSFGVAGTDEGYAGEGSATEPVADGTYTMRTLFLVPLPLAATVR